MGELGAVVDRCLFPGFDEPRPPDWLLAAVGRGIGGVVLYGQNLHRPSDVPAIAGTLRRERGDVLVAVDEEGGDVTRLHYRTGSPYPGSLALGVVDDPALTERVAGSIGAELRTAGVSYDLAPVVDVNADPDNPVIGVRSFGADTARVGVHGAAYVRGLQATGVAGCAKHFPGHGDTRADSHADLPTIGCDEAELRRVHLPPFAAAIAAGVRSVMTAHILFPALDDVPATVSRRILTGLLRDDLGYRGVVLTDAMDMGAITRRYPPGVGAVRALAAGADAICLGAVGAEAAYRVTRDAVLDAVRDGELPLGRLEEAADRVDALRAWTVEQAGTRGTPDPDLGLRAARLAVRTVGTLPPAGEPTVLELHGTANLAVGEAAWSLGDALAAALDGRPGGPAHVWTEAGDVDAVLRQARAGPLVVAGRDVHRHPWQRGVLAVLRARRPDTVLVELGVPDGSDVLGPTAVLCFGAGRPNLRAAAEVLLGGHQTGRNNLV